MKIGHAAWVLVFCGRRGVAQAPNCNMQDWKPIAGVSVTANHGSVEVVWPGEQGQQNRARLGIRDGQPVVEELAAQESRRRVDCAGQGSCRRSFR